MQCLRLPDGWVTSEISEMREGAVSFYEGLYAVEDFCPACAEVLLENLPQLSSAQRTELDTPVTFQELSEAAAHMASGRCPGVDGLPAEFYKIFWSVLGPDWYEVVLEYLHVGELPLSHRRAVLTLLPKKGDLSDL